MSFAMKIIKDVDTDKIVSGKELLDHLDKVMEMNVGFMKKHMESTNEDARMNFSFITSDLQIILFPPEALSSMPKAMIADIVLNICENNPIVAVAHSTEGWMLKTAPETEEEYRKLINIYGSIRDCPDSVEIFTVMISYNIKGESIMNTYSCPIINHEDGTRSLDEENAKTLKDVKSGKGLFNIPADVLIPIEV